MTQHWRERSVITHCVSLPNTIAIGFQSCAENILCYSKEPGGVPLVENVFQPVSKEGKGSKETVFQGLDEE